MSSTQRPPWWPTQAQKDRADQAHLDTLARRQEAATTATAATIPMALKGLADHIITHTLPTPSSIDLSATAGVTIWLHYGDASDWLTTHIDVTDTTTTTGVVASIRSHTAEAVLHDSCVRVTLRWVTHVDHGVCRDCDRVLCYCLDVDAACEGTVEPGCVHPAAYVCDEHRGSCPDCRIDAASDTAQPGWIR